MIEPADLLTHAIELTRGGTETDFRRAASAAYYAVFHVMAWSGSRLVCAGAPTMASDVARSFEHATMARVCQTYANARPDEHDPRLTTMAKSFLELQSARQTADYDLITPFTYLRANELVSMAARTLVAWPDVAPTANGQEFLLKLMLGPRLGRRG